MTTVVSDTSPINYLCLIGEVDVLPKLFATVLIPPTVLAELRHPRAPQPVAAWLAQMPEWVIVRPPLKMLSGLGLDTGETEAISLTLELHIPAIVMDERRGRLAAEKREYPPPRLFPFQSLVVKTLRTPAIACPASA